MYNDIKEKSIKLRSVFQETTQSKIRSKIQKKQKQKLSPSESSSNFLSISSVFLKIIVQKTQDITMASANLTVIYTGKKIYIY